MGVGTLIGGGMSVLGGVIGGNAAAKAAKAQARAMREAINEMRRQFDETQSMLAPYRDVGEQSIRQYNRLMGLTGEAPDYSLFERSPDYQFALQQGQQALERSAAARGALFSGNTGAALQQFGQGLASQQLGNYTNRLMQLMGMGQNSAAGTAAAGMGTAQSIADTLVGMGDARAAGIMGRANAWTNALGQLGGIAMDFFKPSDQRTSGVMKFPGLIVN
jgi:type II secretory pathway pseudopilin PulG